MEKAWKQISDVKLFEYRPRKFNEGYHKIHYETYKLDNIYNVFMLENGMIIPYTRYNEIVNEVFDLDKGEYNKETKKSLGVSLDLTGLINAKKVVNAFNEDVNSISYSHIYYNFLHNSVRISNDNSYDSYELPIQLREEDKKLTWKKLRIRVIESIGKFSGSFKTE